MPIRRARPTRRAKRSMRRSNRRVGRPSRGLASSQMAKIVETVEFQDLKPNEVKGLNFSLVQFARASCVASSFKFYRATKVEWILDPLFNTFQEGTSTGVFNPAVPYLYTRMNRNQDSFAYSAQNLQAMGAKPRKFTKQIRITYRPNWCSPGLSSYAAGQLAYGSGTAKFLLNQQMQGRQVQYGWLAAPGVLPQLFTGDQIIIGDIEGNVPVPGPTPGETTDMTSDLTNLTLYNGTDLYIDQLNPNTQFLGRVTCTVHWEFKEPNFQQVQVAPAVEGVDPVPIAPIPSLLKLKKQSESPS